MDPDRPKMTPRRKTTGPGTPDLSAYNFTVPIETVAQAIKRVQGYTFDERIRRFDDVAQRQMPVLCAGLDLKHHAIPMRLVDHSLQVILILFEIFELAAPTLPTVSQQQQFPAS